jgi:hypothetical protein
MRLEGLGKLKKIHLNGIRSRDLPACTIVPEPTTLLRAPKQEVQGITNRLLSFHYNFAYDTSRKNLVCMCIEVNKAVLPVFVRLQCRCY